MDRPGRYLSGVSRSKRPIGLLVPGLMIVLLWSWTGQAAEIKRMAPSRDRAQPAQPAPAVRLAPPAARKARPPAAPIPAAKPLIRRISPVGPLKRGGDWKTVNVSGSNLHLITSVRVLKNGRPAPGVTARLGPPSASTRLVKVSARADAVAGTYALVFLADGEVVESGSVSAGNLMAEFMKLNVVDPADDPETINDLNKAQDELRDQATDELRDQATTDENDSEGE